MTDKYSPKSFLRTTSPEMLAAYFRQAGLLPDFNFVNSAARKRTDALHDAICALSDEIRQRVQQDFQDILWLSNKAGGGLKSIIHEATFQGVDLSELDKILELRDKIMWVFLHHSAIFNSCLRLAKRHLYSQTNWRQIDIPTARLVAAPDRLIQLSNQLKRYFTTVHGKGTACQIEFMERGNLHYFFAYLDDYCRREQEYDNTQQLKAVLRRPAFEVVMVFDTATNRLDLFVEGGRPVAQIMQQEFSKTMLSVELPERRQDKKIYDLNPLRNRSFEFTYGPESGITSVRVNYLRFTSPDGAAKVIIENADGTAKGIYDVMDQVLERGGIYSWRVTKANITVTFAETDGRQDSIITFNISHPSTCTLSQEGRFGIIRQMLKDSGIDVTQYEANRLSA